jgi:hypothetical protein
MIPRYSRPEMTAIWEPQTRFRIWFEIEAHAADAMAEAGIVPKAAAQKIWAMGRDAIFDVARIDAIEAETKHDVIAFLTHLSEIVGPELHRREGQSQPPRGGTRCEIDLHCWCHAYSASSLKGRILKPSGTPIASAIAVAVVAIASIWKLMYRRFAERLEPIHSD